MTSGSKRKFRLLCGFPRVEGGDTRKKEGHQVRCGCCVAFPGGRRDTRLGVGVV